MMSRDVSSIGVGCTTLDVEMARKHEWTEDDISMAWEMIRAAVLDTNRRVAARRGHTRQCPACECWTRPHGRCHLCEMDQHPVQLSVPARHPTDDVRAAPMGRVRFGGRLVRHLTSIDLDLESVHRGGSSRKAACICGWSGHERATLAMAADDAMVHESGGATSLGEIPIEPGDAVKDAKR